MMKHNKSHTRNAYRTTAKQAAEREDNHPTINLPQRQSEGTDMRETLRPTESLHRAQTTDPARIGNLGDQSKCPLHNSRGRSTNQATPDTGALKSWHHNS